MGVERRIIGGHSIELSLHWRVLGTDNYRTGKTCLRSWLHLFRSQYMAIFGKQKILEPRLSKFSFFTVLPRNPHHIARTQPDFSSIVFLLNFVKKLYTHNQDIAIFMSTSFLSSVFHVPFLTATTQPVLYLGPTCV